jgi:hypothetical protein
MLPSEFERTSRSEALRAGLYLLILLWCNAYIVSGAFYSSSYKMASMHGFWSAIAAHGGGSWFHATWWPYWEMGAPFECIYSPLVPGLAAGIAALRGVSAGIGFYSVTGLCYILGPMTLFFAAWRLTRAPGASFAAAMAYSLTSVSQIVVPDGGFSLQNLWSFRRLFVTLVWDDTPHVAALTLLPLAILFLARSIEKRRPIYYAATAACIAGCGLASAFGPVMVAMAAVCLLSVLGREHWRGNLVLTVGLGVWGWAIAAPFFSPWFLAAVGRENSASTEGWSQGSITALAVTILGWAVLWHYLPRWTSDWRVRFFALFAWVAGSISLVDQYLHEHYLPQPSRYKLEMELTLCLAAVFAIRPYWNRMPAPVRCAAAFLLLALAGEQVRDFRAAEVKMLAPADISSTVEYHAATWAQRNYPNLRFFMPGSIAQWTNAFSEIQQFTGESWSMAINQVQQRANAAVTWGDADRQTEQRRSLVWLKAFGVGVVGIPGKNSDEFWKKVAHPETFEGALPVLWQAGGVTMYRVPLREVSLAHTVPENAIVRRKPAAGDDTKDVERYVAGLDDASLPATSFEWEGRNRIRIRTTGASGNVVSVQETYHPGWHATVAGRRRKILQDGLGLMWLRPECNGPCEIVLDYDGGWELRLCRWLSWLALAAVAIVPLGAFLRRKRAPAVTNNG